MEKCGNSLCSSLENAQDCSDDCKKASEPPDDSTLYIKVMIHLERWKGKETNKTKFAGHATVVKSYTDIFEKYEAKLTLEARPKFVEASKN